MKLNLIFYCNRYWPTTLLFRDCQYIAGNLRHRVLFRTDTNIELWCHLYVLGVFQSLLRLIADVVAESGYISFVGAEVQKINERQTLFSLDTLIQIYNISFVVFL